MPLDPVLERMLSGGQTAAPQQPAQPSQPLDLLTATPTEKARAYLAGNGQMNPERLKAGVKGFLSGYTANFGDEASAALTAAAGRPPGAGPLDVGYYDKPFGQRYDENLQAVRAGNENLRSKYPEVYMGGEIAGGVANPIVRALPTKGLLPGMLSGAGIGATYGFGAGEGAQNRLEKAVFGGLLGAGTGAVTGKLGDMLSTRTKPAPSLDELRQQATTAWRGMENAGVLVDKSAWDRFGKDVVQLMAQKHINPKIHPKAFAAMEEVTKDLGGNPTLETIHQMRQIVGDVLASGDKADRRLAGMMMDKLDDFIDNVVPRSAIAGSGKAGAEALREGVGLSKRLFKAEDIQRLVDRAQARVSANYTNAGFQTALKQEFKSLLLNEKKFRKFSSAEQMAIRKIVSGGVTEDVLRYIGKYTPTSPLALLTGASLPMLAGVPAEVALPVGAAVAVGGTAARSASTRMTQRAVDQAMKTITGGGPTITKAALDPVSQGLLESLMVAPAQLTARMQPPFSMAR